MNEKELGIIVEKAIKYQLLNELFSETISDLKQGTIHLTNERELDLSNLIKKLTADDLLITNANYQAEKRDFSVIDSSGEVLLTVSPDGHSINSKAFEYFLDDADEMNRLIKVYRKVSRSDTAYTVSLEE